MLSTSVFNQPDLSDAIETKLRIVEYNALLASNLDVDWDTLGVEGFFLFAAFAAHVFSYAVALRTIAV